MDSRLREQLFERCNGYCEWCGRGLPDTWAAHHRKLKSRGGKDEITNLVALCHPCHNLGTKAVHLNVTEATRRGMIVASWANPSETPITLSGGVDVYLTPEGGYERTAHGEGTPHHGNRRTGW